MELFEFLSYASFWLFHLLSLSNPVFCLTVTSFTLYGLAHILIAELSYSSCLILWSNRSFVTFLPRLEEESPLGSFPLSHWKFILISTLCGLPQIFRQFTFSVELFHSSCVRFLYGFAIFPLDTPIYYSLFYIYFLRETVPFFLCKYYTRPLGRRTKNGVSFWVIDDPFS